MNARELISGRRSVNFFDHQKKVDDGTMREIYELAKYAPSSFNMQPWKILMVSDPDAKEKLRECAFGQPKVTEASHVAVLIGDKKAYEKMDPIIDDFIAKGYYTEEARETYKGMAKNLYSGKETALCPVTSVCSQCH